MATQRASSTVKDETEQETSPGPGHGRGRGGGGELKMIWPFAIPSTAESAGHIMMKNLDSLRLYYFEFFFVVLFISLIPQRKVSFIILVAAKEIAFLYLLLIRSAPIFNNFIDRRVVFFLLVVITSVLLILTGSVIHLVVTFGAVTPIILVHAVMWKWEEVVVWGTGGYTLTHDIESNNFLV